MELFRKIIIFAIILLVATGILSGCRGRKIQTPVVDIHANPPDSTLAITIGEPDSDDSIFFIWKFPENTLLWSGARSKALSVWSDGMLYTGDDGVEWWDLDRETVKFEKAPDSGLTSWDKPIAVSPENRTIYAFAHSVEPLRSIRAFYTDEREPKDIDQFVGDIVETLPMLPSNGWPLVIIDRPGQAGAVTPEKLPTKRLRAYWEERMSGEFTELFGLYPLDGGVVIHRAEGWWLLEPGDWRGVVPRSMSLSHMDGELKPLLKDRGNIVISAEHDLSDDKKVSRCVVYRYGAYTRETVEIWETGKLIEGSRIVAADAIAPDDYLFLLASGQDKILTLVRFNGGNAQKLISLQLRKPFSEAFVYSLVPKIEEPPETELVEETAVEEEPEEVPAEGSD